jgi:hypothetical protein
MHDQSQWLTLYQGEFDNSRLGTVYLNLQMIGLDADASSQNPRQFIYPVKVASDEDFKSAALLWTSTSTSTNSEETFSKIKAWLDRCEKTHPKCRYRREMADTEWCPTRLIEISPNPSHYANELVYKIVEFKPEDIPENLRYITLSHRWPQDQQDFQKLTVDKLPQWKVALPVNRLRQIFQDAFLVAHGVGISYVWIDSLCIIQDGDNFADWKTESPKMQKVYSNAQFNICAMKNDQDGNCEGLFSSRETPNFQSLPVELFGPDASGLADDDDDGESSCDDSGHYLIRKESSIGMWDAVLNNSPLDSRGWIFQEQLLSHANVHFGGPEVLFECLEMRASETLGLDKDYEPCWEMYRNFFKEHLPSPNIEDGGSVASDESSGSDDDFPIDAFDGDDFKRWHDLLRQYTTRQLTKFDDRLVAMSGVAQYFKKFFSQTKNDLYIAGLWRSRLATELLWEVADATSRGDREEREQERRNFTFSWVSVAGEIKNQADPHSPPGNAKVKLVADLEVIKYRMSPDATNATAWQEEPFAEDIFSLPSMPTIEVMLRGFLRPITLERVSAWFRRIRENDRRGRDDTDVDLDLCMGAYYVKGQVRLDAYIDSPELTSLNGSGRLFLMPLAVVSGSLWLLLLELVETTDGANMGRFRRIGVHQLETTHWIPSADKWMEAELFHEDSFKREAIHGLVKRGESRPGRYEDLSELPCWRYDESSERHTIFII